MLLDTLKKFAFYNMDVEISKDKDTDYIVIENRHIETHTRSDGYLTKNIHIVTKINLDGEIVSSKIFLTFKIRVDNNIKNSWRIIDKSSQEYSDILPSLHSEEIQKSIEVYSCDILTLKPGYSITIDKSGKII